MSVRERYEQALAERGYRSDEAQARGVAALARCEDDWLDYLSRRGTAMGRVFSRPPIPRGVYLWGGVGRGKSFLMDVFYQSVPLRRKTRLHFHEFMREVHRELADMRGVVDPLKVLAKTMSRRFRLVCLDEFHVADITDAMILHRLLEALFENRVGMVTTSNFPPSGLYPNGMHRDRILPAIALLEQKLEVVNVDAGVDYRQTTLQNAAFYLTPLGPDADRAMAETFDGLAETADEDPVLRIEHREIRARRRAGGVVWFEFRELCGGPRSQNDYLELASQFHTVLVSNVPQMSPRTASEARRFTLLVDVLYDRRVKLVLSSAVDAPLLYTEGPLAHEFPRTVSRLSEMRSPDYLAAARRSVDTSLT